jgi:hypothetical protein
MSKLSPSGQSMAALFSPEGEKLRAAQKEKASSASEVGGFRVPGMQPLGESSKPQDSLGNPNSPGYEPLNLKKKTSEQAAAAPGAPNSLAGFESPVLGPHFIRLGLGWEKVLLTQKKLCEKAKKLITLLEGPGRYRGQKKSSVLQSKSRGAILDVDLAETQAELEAAKKKAG